MFKNDFYTLSLGSGSLFLYKTKEGKQYSVGFPAFEIDGDVCHNVTGAKVAGLTPLSDEIEEITVHGQYEGTDIVLTVKIRAAHKSPVIKFMYRLTSESSHKLTKSGGKDNIKYFSCDFEGMTDAKEIRLSEYNNMIHSFCLNEVKAFEHDDIIMGPMLTASSEKEHAVMAYEHGSQYPDIFTGFEKYGNNICIKAVRGNYYTNQPIGGGNSYETIWFQFGAVDGSEQELAERYRDFILNYTSLNLESRKPYIFYNTWAYQERNKCWYKNNYLDSMNYDRIMKEIDVAHKMGVDIFVLDTGWYKKTGDWHVNLEKFPDGLKDVKSKLDSLGMKLGLWFDPGAAAKSSKIYLENTQFASTIDDKPPQPHKIWETEDSYSMCLVSDYWERFADRLIGLVKELGVSYFKWDAIWQYGCNSGKHNHGTDENSFEERNDCYAFNLGTYMSKIVDKLCGECKNVIVDFDITEGHRNVGLGFLSSGKYFLTNNGPYYNNFDVPETINNWPNIFVYPGPARGWMCRTPINYDKWIPSVLFLTHYLPDEPYDSQLINLASMLLGQNGIWGDLLSLSNDSVELFGKITAKYKELREDITKSTIKQYGMVGSSLEVCEKINHETGRGIIVAFGCEKGCYRYKTSCPVSNQVFTEGNVQVTVNENNAVLDMTFDEPSAVIVFFG